VAQVLLTSLADADVDDIIADIGAQAGWRTAEKYVAALDRLFLRLAEYPFSGSPRKILGPHVRVALVWPYVVIYDYQQTEDVVMILRILHGHREISRRMLKDR
jgi:plasmid stabilization system protein ParE